MVRSLVQAFEALLPRLAAADGGAALVQDAWTALLGRVLAGERAVPGRCVRSCSRACSFFPAHSRSAPRRCPHGPFPPKRCSAQAAAPR